MKPPSGPSKPVAVVSSLAVDNAGPVCPLREIWRINSVARTPASELRPSWIFRGSVEFLAMIDPPADSMSALNHTVSASARMPWTPISLPWSCAAETTWSQVTGFVMSSPAAEATDLRYQRGWVLDQNGTATSFLSQVEVSTA